MQRSAHMDGNIALIVEKARSSWLKNVEVLELLENFGAAGLAVCQEPPVRPEGAFPEAELQWN